MGTHGFCIGVDFYGSSLIYRPHDCIRVDSQFSPKSQYTQLNPNSPILHPCAGGRILSRGRSLPSPQVFASADGAPLAPVDDRR